MSLITDSKFLRLISSRLRNFKQKKDYLWNFSCPLCGDSKKNLSKARGYVFAKGANLFYSCHNCGVGTNLANLIKNVDGSLLKEYVLERFKERKELTNNVTRRAIDIVPPRFDKVDKQKVFEHAEWCDKLPEGHFCLNYIRARQIPEKFYSKLLFTSKYKQFVDALIPDHGKKLVDDARLIIPFYNKDNVLIGIAGRALETNDYKLRYLKIKVTDTLDRLVYGIDAIDTSLPVKIVEGEIDSMFLSNCIASGDSSLALTANNVDGNTVLIFDNEPRNKEIVSLMNSAIKSNNNIVIWPNTITSKDINEMIQSGMTSTEVEYIISKNTFTGLEAQTKFVFWKKI